MLVIIPNPGTVTAMLPVHKTTGESERLEKKTDTRIDRKRTKL